ncbi:YvrJ family protein [Alkalicoccobacillus plakortidis]|uniref:YvrJ family protein n=1 Tax=Alkalicoccobacillus plakortidis TaxID=444060 RepID=A0ABT0XQ06_9BACI|nr:YvrJ family protein [Alkalicoccobacillus plakortidis]MCM2677775.1 YvrJ family protein [Alkalicoccobacillus plakortidis]
MSSVELWVPLISEYGFPIMVTLYLLNRLERKLDKVTEAVETLPTKLNQNPTS